MFNRRKEVPEVKINLDIPDILARLSQGLLSSRRNLICLNGLNFITPGDPINTDFVGASFEIPSTERWLILWADFTAWTTDAAGGLEFDDLESIVWRLNHNANSFAPPSGAELFPTEPQGNIGSMRLSGFIKNFTWPELGSGTTFHHGACGYIPIFRTIGPNGVVMPVIRRTAVITHAIWTVEYSVKVIPTPYGFDIP